MLRWRLLLGTLLIAMLVGLCWLDGRAQLAGTWLFPLALGAALLGANEMLGLLAARQIRPLPAVVYLGTALVVSASWLPGYASELAAMGHVSSHWGELPRLEPLGWTAAALALSMLLVLVGEMIRYREPGSSVERLGGATLAVLYVGLLMAMVVGVRLVAPGVVGIALLGSLVAVVKMCDTGAYTVGRLCGRHKMAPRLSPGKTIEGALGGLAFALVGSWVVVEWWIGSLMPERPLPAWFWIAYGLSVGMAGMAGDLAESLLKRDLGRKDSSTWMPGFGGVLDVLDSILFAAPVAWLWWSWVLRG